MGQPTDGLKIGYTAPLRIQLTAKLVALVSHLQRDLQLAISGAAPHRPWGFVRSGGSLLMVVRHMVLSIVLTTNIPFTQRTELRLFEGNIPASTVQYEPITPAALSPRFAFGALAIIAAVLDSLEAPGEACHIWEQDGVPPIVDAASFLAWLNDQGRNSLQVSSRQWNSQVSAVLWGGLR